MSAKPIFLTEETFESEVLNSDLPVLIDFYADWCGPCKAIGPIVEKLAEKYEGKAKICKLNVDEQRKIALTYKVMSIPTLFIFKGGEIKDRIIGLQPQAVLEQKLDALL